MTIELTTRLPECKCPRCGYVMDAATPVEDKPAKPSPGDLSICIECSTWLIFNEDLSFGELTTEEAKKLPDDVQEMLWRMRRAVHEIDRTKRRSA